VLANLVAILPRSGERSYHRLTPRLRSGLTVERNRYAHGLASVATASVKSLHVHEVNAGGQAVQLQEGLKSSGSFLQSNICKDA
jgi:hypothetical protein